MNKILLFNYLNFIIYKYIKVCFQSNYDFIYNNYIYFLHFNIINYGFK